MGAIEKLNKDSSLHQIVEAINNLIGMLGNDSDIISTLTKASVGEKVSYTASPSVFVTGEVFTVKVSGTYKIVAVGDGTSKYAIKDVLTGITSEYQDMSGGSESPEYFLSEGDKIFFYASSTITGELKISLVMTGSFFFIIQQALQANKLVADELSQVKSLLQTTDIQQKELMEKASFILNNHTSQVVALQQNIEGLAKRVSALE